MLTTKDEGLWQRGRGLSFHKPFKSNQDRTVKILSRLLLLVATASLMCGGVLSSASAQQRPNIVLIYADDVGYGDFSSYGATSVKTPNVDRLAKQGLRFTSGYASSGTCTPSRYSMLTGEYAFRKQGTGVLPGDAALIIEPGRTTLASLLKRAGYATAVVGKWHLGLGEGKDKLDWNAEIKPGPLEIGFDYSFIMAATGDRVPTVYLENRRVVGLDSADPIKVSYEKPFPGEPTGISHRNGLKMDWSHGHNNAVTNGIGRIGFMSGGKSALWVDEDMADVFTRKAVSFIEQRKDKPFFLYFATHDIHVPRVPHPRFAGQTSMGPRGDALVEFDWCVGEILKTLDRQKLTKNTLVILTSDNGPVIDDGYKDGALEKLGSHKPAGPLRGGKYSRFEAGTRVPFIVRWPARVKPGVTHALVSQVDLIASLASLTGQRLGNSEAPDSFDVLAALLGQSRQGREHIVEHAGGLALRVGGWKYLEPVQGPKRSATTNIELGNDSEPQLYDLSQDPGETGNLASQHRERVKSMEALLRRIKQDGRSRP
jgi:arylsulfatase A-like enzyme